MISYTVVVPARNEGIQFAGFLLDLAAATHGDQVQIVAVVNGCTDGGATLRAARLAASGHSCIQVFDAPSGVRSKGEAIRFGFREATGEYAFLVDADGSVPAFIVAGVARQVQTMSGDVLVLSRRVGYRSFRRRSVGWLFQRLQRSMLSLSYDTQSPFKGLPATLASKLVDNENLVGWGFESELILVAEDTGCVVVEVEIPWHDTADSNIRVLRDGLAMLRQMMCTRRRWSDVPA
ncbi:MAG: glycosyltransferase [Ilumatobacteraceae bacterium]|nr:glycosyltransferase [Ilumatobacteraceae bacterium]